MPLFPEIPPLTQNVAVPPVIDTDVPPQLIVTPLSVVDPDAPNFVPPVGQWRSGGGAAFAADAPMIVASMIAMTALARTSFLPIRLPPNRLGGRTVDARRLSLHTSRAVFGGAR